MTNRCAIIGTAESWSRCPWDDPELYVVSLNDAWVLGLPRVDEWAELHPFDHMHFRDVTQRKVKAGDIPPGAYVRPQGHLDMLRTMAASIPVWLQAEPPAGWPSKAQRMPIEALRETYGDYWASGPAYMLLHLYDRGFREFQIYGIHLATEGERTQQRPNFEFLLGRLLGPTVQMTIEDGRRRYVGATGVTIVLPVESPLLQHGWRYAYDPKPTKAADEYAEEYATVKQAQRELTEALIHWPVDRDKGPAVARLQRLQIIQLDIEQQRARRAMASMPMVAARG